MRRASGSSVIAPELVGNSYSVSVFVGLDSLFENDREDLAGKRVVLCGYGSGSHAVIQANVVPEGFKETSRRFDLMSRLNARKKLSIEEYEKIHSGKITSERVACGGVEEVRARRASERAGLGPRATGIT